MRSGTKAGPDAVRHESASQLEEFDALFMLLPDWAFVLSGEDTSIIRLNAAAAQRFGEHCLGALFAALWASEHHSELTRVLRAQGSDHGAMAPQPLRVSALDTSACVELRLQATRYRGVRAVFVLARELPKPTAEQPFQGFFRTSTLALSIIDAQDHLLDVSPGFERMVGVSADRIVGKALTDIGVVSSDAGLSEPPGIDPATQQSQHIAILDFQRNGEPRAAMQLSSRLPDAQPGLKFSVAFDITDVGLFRDQLHEQDQRFRALFDNIADGMFFLASDGRFFDVNRAACLQLGYSREELIGMPISNIVARQDFNFTQSIQAVLENGTAAYETFHRHKDGTLIPVFLTLAPIEADGQRAVAGIAHDQTAQKRIEAEVRDARDRMQAILQAMPDILLEIDEDGTFLEVFTSRPELLRLAPASLLGKRIHAVSEPEAVEAVMAGVTTALQYGFATGVQYRVQVGTSNERWMELSAAIRKDTPNSERSRVIAIVRDITERKLREQELERRNDELMRFAYTISHDLRTPLVTIQSFLGYLIRDLPGGHKDTIDRDLYHIQKAAERMDLLLKDLLQLSRVGRKVNPSEHISLRELISDACELVAGHIAAARARVHVPERNFRIWGDRVRLLEVLQNLLDNAIKFSGHLEAPRVFVDVEQRNGEWVITVRDEGLGIDPRYQHKLFGLFEKLHPQVEGTGIGLALVKRIIDTHGGRVWIESVGEYRGATVCFTLPKTTLEAAS